ncbi:MULTISPECIES: hypothetical protein [Sphingomonas]|uniref:Uncharacterized protein n=1 Tax=Sphingomonas molluscorum TaxID=418184 RepID=A0ABU8Q6G6_9SPHN|nr:hypothetical protein [Sphingomonas sp. JUb134]MBM7406660.1 hypothetical protein [Sphingomonas sp. JUb134]
MKRPKPLRQGQVDGLCGIYSILNFFRSRDEFKIAVHEADEFWVILDVAERLGLLRADFVVQGYGDYQLAEIVGGVCDRLQLPFEAVRLGRVGGRDLQPATVFDYVLERGGAAIIQYGDRHWALLHDRRDGKYALDDSNPAAKKAPELTVEQANKLNADLGIAIIPTPSNMLAI